MQVDNSRQFNPLFSPSPFTDFSTDISDYFHTELFSNASSNQPSSDSNSPSTSRASSPHSALLTPPQLPQQNSFPDPTSISNPSFFNFLDEDAHLHSKPLDPMSTVPYDFLASSFGSPEDLMGMGMGIDMDVGMGMDFGMGIMDATVASGPMEYAAMGIDPQLVGTPSTSKAMSDFGEEDHGEDEDDADDENDADADASASASPSSSSAAPSPPVLKSKSRSSKKLVEKDKDKEPEREKLTLTIAPVKVGGHGKARKGTIQSGGIVKKMAATPSLLSAAKDKENTRLNSMPPPALSPSSHSTLPSYMPTNVYTQTPNGLVSAGGKPRPDKASAEDDDDELPHDWRPSPEVFAKMTSKEKRQLRNKISARNFRVRRKEYISTLEGDIAERDRLLDAIRSELGSTQSENLALRQEIAALKRTLIDGRGIISTSLTTSVSSDANNDAPILNLPPPAPLPAQSAAALLAQQQSSPSTSPIPTTATPASVQTSAPNFLIPNTQKDVSSTSTSRFWGGVSGLGGIGMGMGGITPVHRVVLPEVSVMEMGLFGTGSIFNSEEKSAKNGQGASGNVGSEKLQENVNPMMNSGVGTKNTGAGGVGMGPGAFDGFADINPFTMKTLDAYRMHLWGKMAAQHHTHQYQQQQLQQQQHQQQHQPHQQQQGLTGLASSLRPSYFSSPSLPYSSSASLSALLSGKHTPSSYTLPAPPYSPPPPYSSPKMGEKEKSGLLEKLERENQRERAKERETAMFAALASQTLLRKLGSAFWDAFSGSSSGSVGAGIGSGAGGSGRALDEDKVRKVLEGKAVVRIVDVEEPVRAGSASASASVRPSQTQAQRAYERERERERRERKGPSKCQCVTDILEESMKSLSLGKKV